MKFSQSKFEKIMKLNCYTNASLAKAAGMNDQTISRLRCGKTEPHAATVQKLCKALNCKPRDLFEE